MKLIPLSLLLITLCSCRTPLSQPDLNHEKYTVQLTTISSPRFRTMKLKDTETLISTKGIDVEDELVAYIRPGEKIEKKEVIPYVVAQKFTVKNSEPTFRDQDKEVIEVGRRMKIFMRGKPINGEVVFDYEFVDNEISGYKTFINNDAFTFKTPTFKTLKSVNKARRVTLGKWSTLYGFDDRVYLIRFFAPSLDHVESLIDHQLKFK